MAGILTTPSASEPLVEASGAPTFRVQRWLSEVTQRLNADLSDVAAVLARVSDQENLTADLQASVGRSIAQAEAMRGTANDLLNLLADIEARQARTSAATHQAHARINDLENLTYGS